MAVRSTYHVHTVDIRTVLNRDLHTVDIETVLYRGLHTVDIQTVLNRGLHTALQIVTPEREV